MRTRMQAEGKGVPHPLDEGYIVHYADGDWVCSSKLCGHPISVHAPAAAPVFADSFMGALLDPTLSETVPSKIKARINEQHCCVCQRQCGTGGDPIAPDATGVTVGPTPCAHLARSEEEARLLGVDFKAESNFIPLCGTKGNGRQNTCHDAFDNFMMCFIALPDDGEEASDETPRSAAMRRAAPPMRWIAVTRGTYAAYTTPCGGAGVDRGFPRFVTFPHRVHRRYMHEHAKVFFSMRSAAELAEIRTKIELLVKQPRVNVAEWLERVSPGDTGELKQAKAVDDAAAALPRRTPQQRSRKPRGGRATAAHQDAAAATEQHTTATAAPAQNTKQSKKRNQKKKTEAANPARICRYCGATLLKGIGFPAHNAVCSSPPQQPSSSSPN